jgi:hypothetical protein
MEDGDGAGFDVLSFEPDGRERLIEVKTTNGTAATPFFLTRNEMSVAGEPNLMVPGCAVADGLSIPDNGDAFIADECLRLKYLGPAYP